MKAVDIIAFASFGVIIATTGALAWHGTLTGVQYLTVVSLALAPSPLQSLLARWTSSDAKAAVVIPPQPPSANDNEVKS